MTNSQFCLQQRQREQRRLNKLLIAGFVGSAAVHGILAYALPKWSFDPPKQAEEPIEMVLVEKPKPKPKPQPVKPPEPVKAYAERYPLGQTPPPSPKPPEPVKAQTPPPKPAPEPTPAPKKVVTDPAPAPSQPIVSVPIENTGQSSLTSDFAASSSSVAASSSSASGSIQGKPGGTRSVATNSAPPRPEADEGGEEGISCVSNCEPEYPSSLEGEESSAGVKLTVDPNGNVVGAELVEPHSNSGVNRQALLAARQMQFSSPGSNSAAVQINIDFTVEGSEYDRAAREEQERKEQAAKERQEQEAARQQQLERERQARQEQLERERQARQQELQQQQQTQPEPIPPPAETKPESKPLPTLSPEELDEAMQRGLGGFPHERLHQEERLRKFRERIENYQ